MAKIYLDRSEVLKKVGYVARSWGIFEDVRKKLTDKIKSIPAGDVAPVKHGKWSSGKGERGTPYAHCSACGQKMSFWCYGYAYCALCGARMDGDAFEKGN